MGTGATDPATALGAAVGVMLAQDATLAAILAAAALSQRPPANGSSPFITFGRTGIPDWVSGAESQTEQLLTLHVWSKANGEAEARQIMDLARARLSGAIVTPAGAAPLRLTLEFSETRYDEDLGVHHGLLRFRAGAAHAAERPTVT